MKITNSSTAMVLILSALTLGLGALVALVSYLGDGQELDKMIEFLLKSAPLILGFAFMASRQDRNDENTKRAAENTEYIAGRVNGNLDWNFNDLRERLDRIDPTIGKDEENGN